MESSTSAGSQASASEESRGHYERIMKQMQSYLENEQLCDVVLIAGIDSKRVPAHRMVLCASSEYFAAMFMGSFGESKKKKITLGEVHGDTLEILVKFCYTGLIELQEDTVETVLATACFLQFSAVVTKCCNFLARQLHPSNCLSFAYLAEKQSCVSLLKLASAYTCTHFVQVCKNQEFFQLNAEQLAKLLSSDDLDVSSEQDVFRALMSWIRHDPTNRKEHFPQLLALIRLPLLQPLFIVDHVKPLCSSSDCKQLVVEALNWHLVPERRYLISNERTRLRKSKSLCLLAVGGTRNVVERGMSIESYCPRLDKWMDLETRIGSRSKFGAALMDDKLIIVGGQFILDTFNTVESLDLNSMVLSSLTPMGTHRHSLGVAVLEGALYAVGGSNGMNVLNTVERWDPVTRTWSYVAPMNKMRAAAGVAVLGSRLYVVGGNACDGYCSVECYNPHRNQWFFRAPMKQGRHNMGVAIANGYLYAVGGYTLCYCATKTVERYDPGTDTWTFVASLSVGRGEIGVALLGDRLIAVGGTVNERADRCHTLVEEYNPQTNKWTKVASLNRPRGGACIVTIPNILLPTPATSQNPLA